MTTMPNLDDIGAVKEFWKPVMDDPAVTAMTHGTPENDGVAFEDEDLDAYLERGLALADFMRDEVLPFLDSGKE